MTTHAASAPRYTVIPSRRYQCTDGRTASPFGSVPWVSAEEAAAWSLVVVGWTVRNNASGTVGVGRQPWPSEAEAQAWADVANAR